MSKCVRCGKEMEYGEVHIFHGGKERVAQLEVVLGHKVSLCGKPVELLEPPVLCGGCRHFIFDYKEQVSCPLCGWKRLTLQ